jgi:hypothetical protein
MFCWTSELVQILTALAKASFLSKGRKVQVFKRSPPYRNAEMSVSTHAI